MNVLLTHAYFLEEDPREKRIMKPYVPLGLLYLSAFLDTLHIRNEVFDSTFTSFSGQKNHLLETRPCLIGIYCNLMTKPNVIRLIEFLRCEPSLMHVPIVLGGPDVRHNARHYLEAGAHLLVSGEGEQTFGEICTYFMEHHLLPENVAGTMHLDGNKELIMAPERELLRDINQLPLPARHKVNMEQYADAWKVHHGFRTFSLSTMRGCPYTCKWCSRAVYGGSYRRRSPRLVADEMHVLQQDFKAERLWFVDDVFTISHKWLREFADVLRERKLKIPYEIITRADRMNEEVIVLLKESGCFRVWIGAESGSQKIVDAMDRRVQVDKVREMIRLTKLAGMEAGTFIMLGYPGEERSDIRQTIQHLVKSEPSHYTVTVTYPIKGTPLYDEVQNSITAPGAWTQVTDRELDFKRKHSKQFYLYAVRWVNHEVMGARATGLLAKLRHKTYSLLAQTLMMVS